MRFKTVILFLVLSFSSQGSHPSETSEAYRYEIIAENLNHPWGIAIIDNQNLLFTELSGKLKRIKDGQLIQDPIAGVPDVMFSGQGGLSGIILDPSFAINRKIYLAFSAQDKAQKTNTLKVISAVYKGSTLADVVEIFSASPFRKTAAHYGARMVFLGDGTLLITSGDGFNYREKAQYLDNHFGKIIRINTDGSVPIDNPFTNNPNAKPEIWSYGHRNPQGIVIRGGKVFAHEHGPMGGDEINLIKAERNYGWPAITFGKDYIGALISPFTEKDGMEQPLKYWVPSIAPSGMTFYDGDLFPDWKGSLFISALVPGDVRRLTLEENTVLDEEILFSDLGRIRDVVTSTDGAIILATDGPKGKLVRVIPK
ncbi:MAG: glucose dehydrogenase [Gammaproteobacteria bacterium]|nr:glucose dehydrogenase [Gammaproteobacteria bacterium]